MSELEQCLSKFEAEFQEQGAHPAGPSRFGGRLWLGIERALMARFLEFDLGRYYGGEAADQIVFQLRMQLFLRRHFPGHTLGRWVAPDLGVALPATVLGVPWSPVCTRIARCSAVRSRRRSGGFAKSSTNATADRSSWPSRNCCP